MMPSGWGLFPWPVLFVIPMIVAAVFMARRRGTMGHGCHVIAPPSTAMSQSVPAPAEDPLVVLRERFARGEIDLREFETRVEYLLRADPLEPDRRPDRSAAVVSTRWTP
jgi:uncharacterized membrane protein